jgi:hypothetical protein
LNFLDILDTLAVTALWEKTKASNPLRRLQRLPMPLQPSLLLIGPRSAQSSGQSLKEFVQKRNGARLRWRGSLSITP